MKLEIRSGFYCMPQGAMVGASTANLSWYARSRSPPAFPGSLMPSALSESGTFRLVHSFRSDAKQVPQVPSQQKREEKAVVADINSNMAPISLSHPFLGGCDSLPKDKDENVKQLRLWLDTQPHLPPLTDEHLHLFLHSNYYNLEQTEETIDSYFTIRTTSPELFSNKAPTCKAVKNIWDMTEMVAVPKTTPEGYNVLIYRLKEFEPSKLQFNDALKSFFLFNDIRLSEDGLSEGYIVIFDMKGVSLGHLTRINLSSIRKFMSYIQEGHPARLKGVHVINAVAFIDKVLALIRPLMKSGLIKLLTIHGSDLTSLFKEVPQSVLPEDYGGESESMAVLHAQHRKMVETKYEKWIEEEEYISADLSKRPKTGKKQCIIASSFKSLSID